MSVLLDPRATFGEALAKVAAGRPEVVAISADSSSGSGLGTFQKQFPTRHLEFGIMEQGVIGFAAGMATMGKIPVVAAIAPFVTSRPFEMVRNDVGYMKQNVKVVGRCGGMTYYDLGSTHHSLEDFAIMSTIPGFTLLSPGDPTSITWATGAMVELVGGVYMRIGNQKMPVVHPEGTRFEIGKAVTLREGSDVTIIASGTVMHKALEAAELLARTGVSARMIDMHTIKPIDRAAVVKAARETGRIVTVEEHYVRGGLGSIVAEVTAEECPVPVKRIGIEDLYASNGPYEDLLRQYGLQADQIAATVAAFLKERV